jgi:hypothetical protein
MHTNTQEMSLRGAGVPALANSGPKGPPSAPPAIPPIIINPFARIAPNPAIDPRPRPQRPPVVPPSARKLRII